MPDEYLVVRRRPTVPLTRRLLNHGELLLQILSSVRLGKNEQIASPHQPAWVGVPSRNKNLLVCVRSIYFGGRVKRIIQVFVIDNVAHEASR